MSDTARGLTLVCPGLLGPLPLVPEPLPSTPTLDRWLARGRRVEAASLDPYRACLSACGVQVEEGRDPPTGAVSLLGEGLDVDPDAFWMHADPVHLRPDRDQLLIFAADRLGPTVEEAGALVESFNAHFSEDGLWLVAPTPARWYLRARCALDLVTSPLHEVAGGSMAAHLPEGKDASQWTRLMNEAQMLFHAHPVNQRRESLGRPMLNGLWAWGSGCLTSLPEVRAGLLIGDHPLIAGLARLGGCRHLSGWEPRNVMLEQGEGALVLFDGLWSALRAHDLDAWVEALRVLEARVTDLDARLRGREIPRVELDSCAEERWVVYLEALRRLWRRRGLVGHLHVGAEADGSIPSAVNRP